MIAPEVKSNKRKADAIAEPQDVFFGKLPSDVIMHVFYLTALQEVNQIAFFSLVCRRWNKIVKTPLIQQLVVQRVYSHLMTSDNMSPIYYTQAADYARQLNALSFRFAGSKKSLHVYPNYLRNLREALNKPDEFFAALPYFDLRPFAWLEAKDWQNLFAKVAPKLSNVQVLQISGIGTSIDFYKLEMLHVPVLAEAFKVTKTILAEVNEIFFTDEKKGDRKMEISNRLSICVGAIAIVSKKLNTLIADNTVLSEAQVRMIFNTFDTINRVYLTGSYHILPWHAVTQLKNDYPQIEFTEKPKH